MKRVSFRLLIALLGVMMMTFTSCKDDDDPVDTTSTVPTLGENFDFVVNGNDVTFTTTLTGNVWFTNLETEADHTVVDGSVTVNLPLKGVYEFTCSRLAEGITLTSDGFDVAIEEDDLSFLNQGLWKDLTGGVAGGKTWVLDHERKFFHNPIDFYGTKAIGNSDNWGPWGGFGINDPEDGWISFNGVTQSVTMELDGVQKSGTFNLDVFERDPEYLIMNDEGQTLWENILNGPYRYLGALSTEMADLTLPSGIRFPIDIFRYENEQMDPVNLRDVTILHASDSTLVLRILRSRDGTKGEEGYGDSPVFLLYNYIVKEYDYGDGLQTIYTPDIITDFTMEDLVGTWKYNEVPFNWLTWTEDGTGNHGLLANPWCTLADVFAGDWQPFGEDTQAEFDAAYEFEFVFNADGTCVLNGVANNFTLENGIIKLENALDGEFSINWFSLSGDELKIVNPSEECAEGLWLAISNAEPGKNESTAVNLVKVEE